VHVIPIRIGRDPLPPALQARGNFGVRRLAAALHAKPAPNHAYKKGSFHGEHPPNDTPLKARRMARRSRRITQPIRPNRPPHRGTFDAALGWLARWFHDRAGAEEPATSRISTTAHGAQPPDGRL